MLPKVDPRAQSLLKALTRQWEGELTKIRAHRAHLFGRIHPPDDLLPDERWDVNLEEPSFTIIWGSKVVTRCEAQLVGTWSKKDRSFLWGHKNPSVAESGTRRIAGWLEQADLAELGAVARFEIEQQTALDLAGLLAVRFGWLGPYPGTVKDALALLLVKPLPDPATGEAVPWCTFCGRDDVGSLVGGSTCSICDGENCLGTFANIATEGGDPDAEAIMGKAKYTAPPGFGCCLCFREDVRVIQHRYTGVCTDCILLIQDAVRSDGAPDAQE